MEKDVTAEVRNNPGINMEKLGKEEEQNPSEMSGEISAQWLEIKSVFCLDRGGKEM